MGGGARTDNTGSVRSGTTTTATLGLDNRDRRSNVTGVAVRAYVRHPTVAGNRLAFVTEDDVWSVPTEGGRATRVTAADGLATYPRLSPDGELIAYTRQDAGGQDVHVVLTDGGPSRRLTWLGAMAHTRGWTPEGDIVFSSDSEQPFRQLFALHTVSAAGGPTERLPLGPARDVAWGLDGTIVVGRNTLDPARWKGHRGGSAGRLWIRRPGAERFRRLLPDLPGDIASPMILGGRVWFLADHEGTGNLYSCRPTGQDLRRHTDHEDFYARWATTDGRRIVYQCGADIWLYSPAAGKTDETTHPVEISVPLAGRRSRPRLVKAATALGPSRAGLVFDADQTAANVALEARGRVVSFGAFDGAVRAHGASGARHRLPRFLRDGRLLMVASRPDGQGLEIHGPGATVESVPGVVPGRVSTMAVSPTGGHAAVATHRGELLVIDLDTGVSIEVEPAGAGCGGPTWSPDGRWVAYSAAAVGDYIRQIRVYDRAAAKVHDVTRAEFGDGTPSFDPAGRYLYFLSARVFEPSEDPMGFELHFPRPVRAYVATLDAAEPDPFDPATRPNPPREAVTIDLTGIADRVRPVPGPPGRYGQLIAVAEGVILRADPVAGQVDFTLTATGAPADAEVKLVTLGDGEVHTLATGVTDLTASGDRHFLLVRHGQTLRRVAVGPAPPVDAPSTRPGRATGWLAVDRVDIHLDPVAEWKQIFDEAWRLMAEFFWDPGMGGVDWDAVRLRYQPLLARVASRSELSDLIWEMQGELGVSHAYEFPGDLDLPAGDAVGHLAIDAAWDSRRRGWRVDRLVVGDGWAPGCSSPLVGPALDIREADVITAIDGISLGLTLPPRAALVGRAGAQVELTVARRGRPPRAFTVRVLRDERVARYRAWVEANRSRVHSETGGRAGYIHVPNMGRPGFAEFHRAFYAEFDREALVVDVRFNEGGFVSTLVLEKLLRRRLGGGAYRWRSPSSYPRQAVSGIIVGICNEHAGSDGDLFTEAFRQLDLGPLVGVRTWGGVIGINLKEPHSDGSVTSQPEFAHWFPGIGWGLEGHGTEPTHPVEVEPGDADAGLDRQLDAALRLVGQALRRTRTRTRATRLDFGPPPDRRRPQLPPR